METLGVLLLFVYIGAIIVSFFREIAKEVNLKRASKAYYHHFTLEDLSQGSLWFELDKVGDKLHFGDHILHRLSENLGYKEVWYGHKKGIGIFVGKTSFRNENWVEFHVLANIGEEDARRLADTFVSYLKKLTQKPIKIRSNGGWTYPERYYDASYYIYSKGNERYSWCVKCMKTIPWNWPVAYCPNCRITFRGSGAWASLLEYLIWRKWRRTKKLHAVKRCAIVLLVLFLMVLLIRALISL